MSATNQHPTVGSTFRPWNIDTLGTVTHVSRLGGPFPVTVRYDHDESKSYTFSERDFDQVGRLVDRSEY